MSVKTWTGPFKDHFNMLCIGNTKISADIVTLCFSDTINVNNEFIMIVTDREKYWESEIKRLHRIPSCIIINDFSDSSFTNMQSVSRNKNIKILLITDKPLAALYSDPLARDVMTNNKNYGITSIIMTDSISSLPVNMRNAIDYVLFVEYCDEYYDDYFTSEPDDFFKRMYEKYVHDEFSALFVDIKASDENNKIFLLSIL